MNKSKFTSFKKPNGEAKFIDAIWAGTYIPEDWRILNIGNEVTVTTGNSFSSDIFDKSGEIPLIKNKTAKTQIPEVYIDDNFDDKYRVKNGDLLVTMDGDFVPRIWKLDDAALNQRVCKVDSNDSISIIYLRYILEDLLNYIQQSTAGTTVKHLSSSDFNQMELPVPLINEQERIASVLYSVDKKLEQLHARKEKHEQLKQGLMQDLLTGEKRVSPDISIINEVVDNENNITNPIIKEDWIIGPLGDFCKIETGTSYPSEEYADVGIPLLRISNIKSDDSDIVYLPKSYLDSSIKYLRKNDVVMAMSGATTGKTGRIRDKFTPSVLNQRVAKFKSNEKSIDMYIYFYICSFEYQKMVNAHASGGAQENISKSQLSNISINCPPLWEQERIASVLYTVDDIISTTDELIDKYEKLKRGLMQDLLSGEVRTPEELTVLEEVSEN